jgi:hypothetical protein
LCEDSHLQLLNMPGAHKGTPPQAAGYSEQPELTVLDPTVANHPLAPQAAGN